MKLCAYVLTAVTVAATSVAQTVYVNGNCGDNAWTGASPVCAGPDGPKQTIQAAIPASGGATIVVAPGTYSGPISISRIEGGQPQWLISIESEAGPASTVIESPGSTAMSVAAIGNGGRFAIRGFTIRNANSGVSQGTIDIHSVDIHHCIFTNCGTAVRIVRDARISNCAFQDNIGHSVHLVPGFQAAADINHCTFLNNGGSAVNAQRAPARLTNSLVAFNGTPSQPALFGTEAGFFTLKNVTVVANHGPGIYASGRPSFAQAPRLTAHNSIVWGNNSGGVQIEIVQGTAPPPVLDLQYCIVQGGFAGTANLSADPLFVNAAAGDFRLGAGSPAIDSGYAFLVPGDQNTDLDHQPRFQDDAAVADSGAPFPFYLDRGAYEAAGRPYCVGDLNYDYTVDLVDLALMLAQFGTIGAGLPGDQDRNGGVGIEDLAIMLSNFGNTCP